MVQKLAIARFPRRGHDDRVLILRHLQLFVTTAEHLHLREAAKSAGVSVGSLSQSMRQLEDDLGCDLFDRSEQRIGLTPAGIVCLDEGRQILSHVERSIAAIHRANSEGANTLRIGYQSMTTHGVLEEVVRTIRNGPNTASISLIDGDPGQLADWLTVGEIDLALGTPSADRKQFERESVGHVGLSIALPPGHPMANRKSIDIGDLADEPLVVVSRSAEPDLFDAFIERCHRHSFEPETAQVVSRAELVPPLVRMRCGIGVLPESVASMRTRTDVIFRPLVEAPRIDVMALRRASVRPTEGSHAADEVTVRPHTELDRAWERLRRRQDPLPAAQ